MKNRVVFLYANFKKVIYASFLFIVCLTLLTWSVVGTFSRAYEISYYASAVECVSGNGGIKYSSDIFTTIKEKFNDIFGNNKQYVQDTRKIEVYPGGFPLGFTLECQGVIIVAIGSVHTEIGEVKPCKDKNVKVGDVLLSVDDKIVKSAMHLQELLTESENEVVKLSLNRDNKQIVENVEVHKEKDTGVKRMGLWVRDNADGVGTLTYVRKDNNRFGALGHPVCDIDTGKVMPVLNGSVYKCNIVGCARGTRGYPGELRGLFLRNGYKAGDLDKNNEYGVYGNLSQEYIQNMQVEPIEVGFKDSVKTGKAQILCTIDGNTPEYYDIEIVKLNYQTKQDKKSMVLKVTDLRLISKTGGIVQGMSGSPIIQNGKLVGAVTHVFVSDPTKGFGVYIDWMIDN